MNMNFLFVFLISLVVISKSSDKYYDDKKREVKGFYDALIQPGLDENGGNNGKLDKLMSYTDDEFHYCFMDRSDGGELQKCSNKNEFRKGIQEKRTYPSHNYDIDIISVDDEYVKVECQFIFKDKSGCTTVERQIDDIYYDSNGKISLIEVAYKGSDKKCEPEYEPKEDDADKPSTTEYNKDSHSKHHDQSAEKDDDVQPSTTKDKDGSNGYDAKYEYVKQAPIYRHDASTSSPSNGYNKKEREDKIKSFYKSAMDCTLKKHKDDDSKLDETLDYFSDNIDFCSQNGAAMNDDNKQCYHGKNAVKNMMKDTWNGKYESVDYIISIKKNEEDYAEIECQYTFKDEDGCIIRASEHDYIRYDSYGKIVVFDCTDFELAKIEISGDDKGEDRRQIFRKNPSTTSDSSNYNKESYDSNEYTKVPPVTPMYKDYHYKPEYKETTTTTTEYNKDNYPKHDDNQHADKYYVKPSSTKSQYVKPAPMYRRDTSTNSHSNDDNKYGDEYDEYQKQERERKIKDFYSTSIECGLHKNEDDDSKLDKTMDYFSDDVTFCSPDGDNMNDDNKKCYHGKNEIKNMMKGTFNGKYESIDSDINIKKNEAHYAEIECQFVFKDKDGCIIRTTEIDYIYYDPFGKIQIFDCRNSVAVRDEAKCGDDKDKHPMYRKTPSTTSDSNEYKESEDKREYQKETTSPTEYDEVSHTKNGYDTFEKTERESQIKDFYKIGIECGLKKHKDDDGELDKMMSYFSDNIRLCSPDISKMISLNDKNVKCYNGKNEVQELVRNTYSGKYESVDYDVDIKLNEKYYASVESRSSYRDEFGCMIYQTETDHIYYDSNGKIKGFDIMDSFSERDPKTCDDNNYKSK